MRALLVVNPKATTTTVRVRDVLLRALSSEVKLDVAETTGRGHATALAAEAVRDGLDVVVALGGDGTVNEVTNGLLAQGPQAGLPSLAVVPAGRTNVFAQALGMPNNAVEATSQLLEALRSGARRTIGLGQAGDRWFTFNAGLGTDAGAVQRVEQARAKGKTATHPLYVRASVREFYASPAHRKPVLTLTRPGADPVDPVDLAMALVCNTDPWTFLGNRPVRPCPEASFDTGLDVFGLTKLRSLPTVVQVARLLRGTPHGRRHVGLHDLAEFTLTSTVPLPLQVDGDALGERTEVQFRSVPGALDVVV